MKKTILRASAGVLAVLVLLAVTVSVVDAASCRIKGNGAHSRNRCRVSWSNETNVKQKNNATVSNVVSVGTNTGDNKANDNTGGDVSTHTGNSNVTVRIVTDVNRNVYVVH